MIKQRKIELLAPAKNLECGIEAINHGADAVYIGAPKFGARAAAVNSLEDIEALVQHAHLFPYMPVLPAESSSLPESFHH